MRNPSVENLSMLKLHAYSAQYRIVGVELERGEERWQAKPGRWRHELRTDLFQVAKIH
jgi:hypothetical protein